MEWLLAILAVLVIGLAAVAGSGKLGEFGPSHSDRHDLVLPVGDLTSSDIRAVRFAVVPRGYAMGQVDEVLSRLEAQLSGAQSYASSKKTEIIEYVESTEGKDHDGSDEASYR